MKKLLSQIFYSSIVLSSAFLPSCGTSRGVNAIPDLVDVNQNEEKEIKNKDYYLQIINSSEQEIAKIHSELKRFDASDIKMICDGKTSCQIYEELISTLKIGILDAHINLINAKLKLLVLESEKLDKEQIIEKNQLIISILDVLIKKIRLISKNSNFNQNDTDEVVENINKHINQLELSNFKGWNNNNFKKWIDEITKANSEKNALIELYKDSSFLLEYEEKPGRWWITPSYRTVLNISDVKLKFSWEKKVVIVKLLLDNR